MNGDTSTGERMSETQSWDRGTLRWNGWGRRDQRFDLDGRDDAFWDWVASELGVPTLVERAPAELDALPLPAVRLSDALLGALRDAVGADHVRTSAVERVFHSFGRSFRDLVNARRGRLERVFDAVVYPRTEEEVAAVLRLCSSNRVAVVPFGGGSSVVGGVEPRLGPGQEAAVCLDVTRMKRVLHVDPVAHTATIQAGIYGPELEEALQARGYTLSHYPQSFEFSTLGGWIAARGAGQQSNGYGVAAKWLVSARVVTPTGEITTRPFPNSAAGPDLNHVIAGSEGVLGVITEATVRLHAVPEQRDYRAYLFRDQPSGLEAVRAMVQGGVGVSMLRLSDPDETRFLTTFSSIGKPRGRLQDVVESGLARAGYGEPCLLLVGVEGDRARVSFNVARSTAVCAQHGGIPLGAGKGRSWYENRFRMPFLREPLLDRGMGVDTLETSTTWSSIDQLYAAVRDALQQEIRAITGKDGIVMCHVSHSYATGASLYFTYVWPMTEGEELAQWWRIKRAASDAIANNDGTISHHHGVGVDHAPWLAGEKGDGVMTLLQAMRDAVDPHGVMNPGKLVDSGDDPLGS